MSHAPSLASVFAEAAKYFPSPLQQFQFFDKTSRFDYEKGRRETWPETVDRAVEYLCELAPPMTGWLCSEGREMILTMQALPSMRLLAMAGPAARRQNLSIYNCAYLPVDDVEAFPEMLIISMSGCGVGFSVERRNIDELPPVAVQAQEHPCVHIVEDSTEGWAGALRVGIRAWWLDGYEVTFDTSHVRPAGAVLFTKGGRASGPEPLLRMLDTFKRILLARQGQHLRSIDVHDLACAVGDAAVSGGMRRTAMISLYSQGDVLMRAAKTGEYPAIRWNANNSEVWRRDPTDEEIETQMRTMFAGQNGEPGIFSGAAAARTMPVRRREMWQSDLGVSVEEVAGTNPCQPAFATVLTPDGIRTFADIDVGSTIWSGKRWTRVVRKVYTGVKPVHAYTTSAGMFVGTENHQIISNGRRVEVQQAKTIDHAVGTRPVARAGDDQAIMDGWVVGDGTVHKASGNLVLLDIGAKDHDIFTNLGPLIRRARPGIGLYCHEIVTTVTAEELPLTYLRRVPQRYLRAAAPKTCAFLRGLYSANGSICGNRITLKAASHGLIRDVQSMLSSIGIVSYTTVNKAKTVQFDNGVYLCKESYDLNITKNRKDFQRLIGFVQVDKTARLNQACRTGNAFKPAKATWEIQDIASLGDHPVYDITVDADEHTYWTGGLLVSNCGEIVLRPFGLCNLSIPVARVDDTITTLRRKVRAATIFGTIQATATKFPGLRPQWQQNAERERLLGVDITGQMDCPLLTGRRADRIFAELRELSREVNVEMARVLGIVPAAAITTVKPAGNSAALLNCGSGVHGRHSRFYVRNARVSAHSPVYKVLRDAGAPLSPENGQDAGTASTWVCAFPCRAPEGAVLKADLPARAQLAHWLLNKRHWTEHNPSCFTGDTRFITKAGLRRFDACFENETVEILNKKGRFVPATVKAFGVQDVWELVLTRCGIRRVIHTTKNHLWPVTTEMQRFRGEPVKYKQTHELRAGVALLTVNPTQIPALDPLAVLHGIVYGDGTKNKTRCSIALCFDPKGADSRLLAPLFEKAGFRAVVRDDLKQVRFYGLPAHWKTLPPDTASPEYLRGFVAGWFAADGTCLRTVQIAAKERAALEWLQRLAPKAGLAVSTKIGQRQSQEHDSFKAGVYHTLTLCKETLDPAFFVLPGKKTGPAKFKKYWKVVSAQPTHTQAPVFCVVEPVGHTFVLEGNILTHNCTITYRPEEEAELIAWVKAHREEIGGISFLPAFDAAYEQMPYVEVDEAEYERRLAAFPAIDWSRIALYEQTDTTTSAQELVCTGDRCELK